MRGAKTLFLTVRRLLNRAGTDSAATVLAVLASLQRWLSQGDVLRERVDRKLSEEGKVERLVELRRGMVARKPLVNMNRGDDG